MNKQEFAKVVQAWADGQEVEFRYLGSKSHGEWITEEDAPNWDSELEYRIKSKYNSRVIYCVASCTDGTTWRKVRDNLKLTYSNNVLTKAEVV